MKFRTKLCRENVQTILGVTQGMEKVASVCALHLSRDKIEFKTRPDGDADIQVFAVIKTSTFLDYRLDSKANNEICLEILLANLAKGLKSADLADACTVKLTKKKGLPCLSILADTITSIQVTQDVPINNILSVNDMQVFREPTLPEPSISLEFPDPRQVRTVLDRMKSLDKFVKLSACDQGIMILKVQTEVVSMRTVFQGLSVFGESGRPLSGTSVKQEDDGIFSVRLNIKGFLNVLHLQALKFHNILLCIVQDRALVLYVTLEGRVGTMTFYIPLLDQLDDEMEE